MKCEKCGANLRIDDAKCPYCNTPNPIAVKHRQDMNQYAQDYSHTKAEVIGNSKRFNSKTFLITLFAITIALYAILASLFVYRNSIVHEVQKANIERHFVTHRNHLEQYMEQRDYYGFYKYVQSKNIRFYYKDSLYDYSYANSATSAMIFLLDKLMDIAYNNQAAFSYKGFSSNLSSNVGNILHFYSYETTDSQALESTRLYLENMKKDMEAALKVYLKLTDEEIESIPSLTDAQRDMLFEEKVAEVLNEQ